MNTNQKIKMLLLISLLINTGCMNDKNLGYGHFKNDVKMPLPATDISD
jgi:hypothetical protein